MSLTQTQTTSFKKELYLAVHDFSTDVFKIALYTADATLNADTTVYTSANEVVGTGYTAGGIALTGAAVDASSGVAYVNFNNAVWTAALTARGALIYNSSKSDKSVVVLDFGSDKTSSVTFTVQMPANTSTSALIRSAQG